MPPRIPGSLIAMLLLLSVTSIPARADCFVDYSHKEQAVFGSPSQASALHDLVASQPDCRVIGLAWEMTMSNGIKRRGALVFDEDSRLLTRMYYEPRFGSSSYRLEYWSGATRGTILRDDPADGFDLPDFHASPENEPVTVTSAVRDFLYTNQLADLLP